jgi:hypothetical protein
VGEGRRRGWIGIGLFTAAAVAGGSLVGAVAGLVGVALPRLSTRDALLAVAAVGLGVALLDGQGRTPTLRRQTRPHWWRIYGPYRAALMWGFDLGLGFTTIRVASLYWAVLVAVVLLASPATGALVFAAYGLAIGADLAFGLLFLDRPSRGLRANIRALELSARMKTALLVSLVLWSAFLGVKGLTA